jgi:type IV secretory pathway component VirB8
MKNVFKRSKATLETKKAETNSQVPDYGRSFNGDRNARLQKQLGKLDWCLIALMNLVVAILCIIILW